jgi:uncharacterized OB-fold protein
LPEDEEILISHQVLQVPYKYSAGPVASRFFMALRDEQKIYGIRCPNCGIVYVPPRATCGKCFSELSDWVELSGIGRVETFTRVNYLEPVQPVEDIPFILAVIKLEGADTGMAHIVGEVDEKDLKIGTMVEPVFREKRIGHILDIKYFRPVKAEQEGKG